MVLLDFHLPVSDVCFCEFYTTSADRYTLKMKLCTIVFLNLDGVVLNTMFSEKLRKLFKVCLIN